MKKCEVNFKCKRLTRNAQALSLNCQNETENCVE